MKKRTSGKPEPLLNTIADAIGSTLGTLAAKADSSVERVTGGKKPSPRRASQSKRTAAGRRKSPSRASKRTRLRARRSAASRRS